MLRRLAAALLGVAAAGAAQAAPYANGFPAGPDFFPIAVWMQAPQRAPAYQKLGINTIVGLFEGPTEAQLAEAARHGIYVVAEQNETALKSPYRDVIKGWMQADEPDNAQLRGLGKFAPCVPASEVARRTAALKARDPTRPVLVNFGRGVADETWPGRGACTGDLGYYGEAMAQADIVSFDIYPVANDRPQVQGKLEYVARGVARLREREAPGQRVWADIETTGIYGRARVTPAQLRAEVWMALVHGATGIVYFAHEWTGGFREDGIFRYPEIVAEVARTNATLRSLARALNGPGHAGGVVGGAPVAALVKESDGRLYVLAVAMSTAAATADFALPGIDDAEATVIGEDRSVAVHEGRFADRFAGYGVHLYSLPLPPR
jgi:hypothetical protein